MDLQGFSDKVAKCTLVYAKIEIKKYKLKKFKPKIMKPEGQNCVDVMHSPEK